MHQGEDERNLPRPIAKLRHLFLVTGELTIQFLNLNFDGTDPRIGLSLLVSSNHGPRPCMCLTELIASCRVGLGFRLDDVPKMRFMVVGEQR